MPTATKTPLPDSFDFVQAVNWLGCQDTALQAVLMDAIRYLAAARIEADTEAYMDAFGHMVMATTSQGMGLAEWPVKPPVISTCVQPASVNPTQQQQADASHRQGRCGE